MCSAHTGTLGDVCPVAVSMSPLPTGREGGQTERYRKGSSKGYLVVLSKQTHIPQSNNLVPLRTGEKLEKGARFFLVTVPTCTWQCLCLGFAGPFPV